MPEDLHFVVYFVLLPYMREKPGFGSKIRFGRKLLGALISGLYRGYLEIFTIIFLNVFRGVVRR